jgi:ceramide glucosyltransferase
MTRCATLCANLSQAHAGVDARLVDCPKLLGANAKVSTLIHLQSDAKYEVIAVSDADVHVPSDFLAQAVVPLENPKVALVNCFYRLPSRSRWRLLFDPDAQAMRMEEFAVNCDFWSQVLQARSLKPLDFALGAVMITTQTRLRQIGAFQSLVDYLADDYQLGNQIAKAGGEIVISPVVVDCRSAPMTMHDVWSHQLRWARTIRVSQPVPYFFSILNDSTLWFSLWLFFMVIRQWTGSSHRHCHCQPALHFHSVVRFTETGKANDREVGRHNTVFRDTSRPGAPIHLGVVILRQHGRVARTEVPRPARRQARS